MFVIVHALSSAAALSTLTRSLVFTLCGVSAKTLRDT